MFTLGRTCPLCHQPRIYRSRFRARDLFARLVLFTGVRCGDCNYRFYRPVFLRALHRRKRSYLNSGGNNNRASA